MIDTIALKKLRLSPHNVRKGDTDSQIEPLAQSIAAHGLLSNLLVTATPSKRITAVMATFPSASLTSKPTKMAPQSAAPGVSPVSLSRTA